MKGDTAKLTELGKGLGLTELAPDLHITDDDIEFPAQHKQQERSAGLGNGSPVEPSSASFSLSFRHSATFGKLCKALSEAELEFPEIEKGTENPYFGSWYADLAALIKATRGPLAKHGLVVIQAPGKADSGVLLTTMMMHTSEEWLANDLELPAGKKDAQGMGSAITYARRYAYQALLNIAAEDDDDGNTAVGKTQQDRRSSSTEAGPGVINPVQLRAFNSACKQGGKTPQQVLDYMGHLGHESVEELLKKELDDAVKWALAK